MIETPPASRPGSPAPEGAHAQFPFGGALDVSTEYLLSKLPPLDEACVLVDAYYRYFTWAWNVSPRETFQPIFDRVFRHPPPRGALDEWLQELALVFITLAMGALHNLELPPNDPLAEEFFSLAKSALAKGQFMIHNTLPAVQTLVGSGEGALTEAHHGALLPRDGEGAERGQCVAALGPRYASHPGGEMGSDTADARWAFTETASGGTSPLIY